MIKKLLTLCSLLVVASAIMPTYAKKAKMPERQMEKICRGLVCIPAEAGVAVSWRAKIDEEKTEFNVYKNGKLLKKVGAGEPTFFIDLEGSENDAYQVRVLKKNKEIESSREIKPWAKSYLEIPLNLPGPQYFPCESSVADLDGDGEYEFVLKWDPNNSKDNAHKGVTDEVFFDAYRFDGTFMWRVSMGRNIRAGAHYSQFMVYDFDGDGKAEMAVRTAPGTIDGVGQPVLLPGDSVTADYRNENGTILYGSEYLTVFSGVDGRQLASCPFEPERGDGKSWGDNYGNRSDRFLSGVAYLDGVHPSMVCCRGYYKKSAVAAFDFDGKKLTRRWLIMSDQEGEGIYAAGNHNFSIADVDGDGCDEIIHGACGINSDGTVMYNTLLGHGDAIHLGPLDPSHKNLVVFDAHEANNEHNMELHDALTGEVLWSYSHTGDNGRALAADIDPRYPGAECWSSKFAELYNIKGEVICPKRPKYVNFRIYWDGDLQDELFDRSRIYNYDYMAAQTTLLLDMEGTLASNGTKSNPNLQADIFGDWREEIMIAVKDDPSVLRLYSTTIPTEYRMYCLMQDPQYRLSIAWQNTAYNQPPHLGVWIGEGLHNLPWKKKK